MKLKQKIIHRRLDEFDSKLFYLTLLKNALPKHGVDTNDKPDKIGFCKEEVFQALNEQKIAVADHEKAIEYFIKKQLLHGYNGKYYLMDHALKVFFNIPNFP